MDRLSKSKESTETLRKTTESMTKSFGLYLIFTFQFQPCIVDKFTRGPTTIQHEHWTLIVWTNCIVDAFWHIHCLYLMANWKTKNRRCQELKDGRRRGLSKGRHFANQFFSMKSLNSHESILSIISWSNVEAGDKLVNITVSNITLLMWFQLNKNLQPKSVFFIYYIPTVMTLAEF